MPSKRNAAKRKERYAILRNLGFSRNEATRLRDQSQPNIERAIDSEQERISNIPTRERTQVERNKLARISAASSRMGERTRKHRLQTERDRQNDYEIWSGRSGFPGWALERIRSFNDRAGLDENDGFGFRQFYFAHVKNIPVGEASELADRDDSEVRHILGISLTSRRRLSLAMQRMAEEMG